MRALIVPILLISASSQLPAVASQAHTVEQVKTASVAVESKKPSLLKNLAESSLQKSELTQAEEQITKLQIKVKLTRAETQQRAEKIDALIQKLYGYVGHTSYVFSGDTPSGWDCSGLTRWFYKELDGTELEHRAGAQRSAGTETASPIPGDIVAFYYPGSDSSSHVGLYVGGGMMIHAANKNQDTRLESVSQFAKGNHSKVAYIRY